MDCRGTHRIRQERSIGGASREIASRRTRRRRGERGGKGRERSGKREGVRESGLAELCALDFGFGQRAVGGAHSTNNPRLIPASAVYVYTCTDPGVHIHRFGWRVTGTLARGRASSPVKLTSH